MSAVLAASGPPVVVLGVSRSGTTLLKEMLDHHSGLAIPPESYFLIPLWDRFRAGRDLEKLLADLAFTVQVREWGVDPSAVRARLPEPAGFPDVIRAIYESYAESRGKPRFGDKTPLYMLHLDLLEYAFARPVYVHIVRDGRDAALSYASMPSGHPRGWLWPRGLADFACRWRQQVEGARALGSAVGPDRYCELRYEDLVAQPAKRLRELCARIGLPFEHSMLEYHRDIASSREKWANHPRLAEPPSPPGTSWRERMRPSDIERFEALAGELLDELGYERAFPRPSRRARARMHLAEAASWGRVATMRLSLPMARRSPVWRWKQSRILRESGLPVPLNSAAVMAPIFTFHAIDNGSAPDSFPPDLFARGMATLHKAGLRTIPLLDLVGYHRNGVRPPAGTFALTFDDGYRSVYEHAAPILARYGWTATVFLLGDPRRRRAGSAGLRVTSDRPLLSCPEIHETRKAGFTFGAHTLTHPDLTRLSLDEAEDEIAGSKAALEEMLGETVGAFAYPFGRYDARTREIAKRYFECACSDRLGIVSVGSDVHALERIDGYYLRGDRLFAIASTPWFPLYVRARAVPRRLRRSIRGGRAR